MKILLIGPYPPPHGGVSVHLAGIERRLDAAGIPHRVLDTSRRGSWPRLAASLVRFALGGWTVHFHSNGHNWKDWSIALVCGLVGRGCAGSILTLHSGLLPEYLAGASFWMRRIVRWTCALNTRVISVSPAIRDALASLGVAGDSMEVAPASLGIGRGPAAMPAGVLDANLLSWIGAHQPLFSTALFFRPEYGFETLVAALKRLKRRYPAVGCLVMGSGEDRASAERLVRESGLAANVLLAGDVEHDTCLLLMSLSDAFIRPTLRDGDSISVREALELEVPVVASRTGFRPRGAILFEPRDVGQLVAAIELALKAGASGDAPEPRSEPGSEASSEAGLGSMDRLMAIYRQTVAAPESAYGAS